jgi:16S rRNA (uracil1498-N3)-methyltransferase
MTFAPVQRFFSPPALIGRDYDDLAKVLLSEARFMADRYFVDQPLGPGRVEVDGPEAHHLATVCRLRPGDAVRLFNGDGREYSAVVLEVARRSVALEIGGEECPVRELRFRLEVAAPLPKGERAPFLVEKLTELGVTAFTPLQTARSVVLPREAKLDRLHRHVIEASKQCGRNVLMEIRPLTSWTDFLCGDGLPGRRVLLHPGGTEVTAGEASDVVAAIGPEGGFTDQEVVEAADKGWFVIGMGPRILRVETAALAMAAVLAASSRS